MKRKVPSTCGLCQTGCGVLLHLEDNKVVDIEGDPQSPVNRGVLCTKGMASLEYLYSPSRLKHPLRRVGARGAGRWERIDWDDALDEIAENLVKIRTAYGPESLAFIRGSFKGGYQGAYLARFANCLGAPNIASMASVCYVPRVTASTITHGFEPVPDYKYPPGCMVLWGANFADTRIGEHVETLQALQNGSKLIIIDPRRISLSDRADLCVQPRPGSDKALALGMINVIINQGLFDEAFVEQWTTGFDELSAHIQDYSPEAVEQATWVKANTIKDAAVLYATTKPAIIQAGNAIDHNPDNFQTARAISILRAITGNLSVPGGELSCSPPEVLLPMGSSELDLRDKLSTQDRRRRLNAEDGLLPTLFYTLPQSLVNAILKGKPYPIRAAFIQGGNILLTYPNAKRTHDALRKLDFLSVADLFMTPTAGLADIVLPVASFLEFDSIVAPPYYPVAQLQQKVAQVGECRSDYEILRDLAIRLGLDGHFWETEEDCLDYILRPAGLTFQEFRNIRFLQGKEEYRKHERHGFATPSGKVELFSNRLHQWGFDPLPRCNETPDIHHHAPEPKNDFPLIFTSWKSNPFRHSGGRQISSLRNAHPEPVVWIHPETANFHGIKEGDGVFIETKIGRIRQKARLTADIDRRVVGVDYAWWFPENGPEDLYGWADANVNILIDDNPPYGKEMGTPNLRGIDCKVYKAL